MQRPWVVLAGALFGLLVLLFFMGLVAASIFGRNVPCEARFLVVVILALGAGLAASFLGGSAAARGKIQVAAVQQHPLEFSVAGGIAVVVLLLVLGKTLYMDQACKGGGGGGDPTIPEMVSAMLANIANNEFDAASRKADEILAIQPDNHRALNVKGSVSFYRGEYRSAQSFFERALKAKPKDPDITFNLADAYIENGAIKLAIDTYESIKSGSVDWHYAQGRAYAHDNRFQDAFKLLEAVPNTHHDGTGRVWTAVVLVGLSRGEGDKDKQADLVKRARGQLDLACKQAPEYWNGVLVGGKFEKRESYKIAAKALENIYVQSKPC